MPAASMVQRLWRIRAMLPATATRRSALTELRQAARVLDAARRRCGSPFAMSSALTAMARACRSLHDEVNAEGYLDEALRWARAAGSIDLVVDLLCELCEVCAALGLATAEEDESPDPAACERMRDHAFEASTLANRVADASWEAKVLMRIGAVLESCGDRDDAVLLQTRALRLMSGSLAAGAPDPTLLPSLGRLADS